MPDSLPPDEMPNFETLCAHWGEDRSSYRGAVIPPIYQNSLFTSPDVETRWSQWGGPGVYDYTRVSNPTTDIAEAKIAALEGGEKARCFSSGMAAISAAILSCVKSGDHIVAVETAYGPTRQFLTDYLPRFGVHASFVEGSDPQEWADARRTDTTLFYLESPSTVVMRQQDLAAVAQIAKEQEIVTICDNSWATPYYQNPLRLGVDLVVHSATKYLGGHSDIVAGVAVGGAERMKKLIFQEGLLLGAVLDPFAAWLLIRGLRTLPLRMERHEKNAKQIAAALRGHPAVENVFYPGQPDDPQAALTRCQLRGTSGLMSLALKRDGKEAAIQLVNGLRYFGIGCSWGGFESLALPATAPAKLVGGSGEKPRWLVRLHIGLESVEDLWNDLYTSLESLS
jgi:cystathionine beta-lyase/cystathionine gamma-synthase